MTLRRIFTQIIIRRGYSQKSTGSSGSKTQPPAEPKGVNANVPGLSSNCVKTATGPVGPGASPTADYKVPEYFLFDKTSFAEAEVEMAKYRCPQPSALRK